MLDQKLQCLVVQIAVYLKFVCHGDPIRIDRLLVESNRIDDFSLLFNNQFEVFPLADHSLTN